MGRWAGPHGEGRPSACVARPPRPGSLQVTPLSGMRDSRGRQVWLKSLGGYMSHGKVSWRGRSASLQDELRKCACVCVGVLL